MKQRAMEYLSKYRVFIILLLVLSLTSCNRDKRALVVGKIQEASKLATTEFTIDKMVHGTKTKKIAWFIKLNEARFLAYSQAIVKTGIDLKKLKKDDILIEGNSIEVTLPPVQVINFSYPPDKMRMHEGVSDTRKFLNNLSVEDQEKLFREAEMDIRNNLKYMGVVNTTQEKTRTMLVGLLKSLGYEEIHIGFKSDELIIDEVPSELN